MKPFSFRSLRILLLLLLLAYAAIYTKSQRVETMSWLDPLKISIFPINADGSPETARYIARLQTAHFAAIDVFMTQQAQNYPVLARPPTRTRLGPEITELPPTSPTQDANPLAIAWWSLALRYWAWKQVPPGHDGSTTVNIFVLYRQPQERPKLRHSLGLQKGLLGIVHAYADSRHDGQNNIVITHEMLHTVGASDKYIGAMPIYPAGYAQPDRKPLHPQKRCEIMAGKIALSANTSKLAGKLRNCVIGPVTAREIHWTE